MYWVTTDDIRRETWARLLNYANDELCFDQIVRRHGAPKNKSTRANYKKQALQVRVSLLQAREYFKAAEIATVFTRPNLLYYGMVSLAAASMLMRGDGNYSLDRLRARFENKSHGLTFSTGLNEGAAGIGTNLLDRSHVTVERNGFFLNWYCNIRTHEAVYAHTTARADGGTLRREYRIGGLELNAKAEALVGRTFSLSKLLCEQPDLYMDARLGGLAVVASRANYEMEVNEADKSNISQWRIHGAGSEENLIDILSNFTIAADHSHLLTAVPENPTSHCIVTLTKPGDVKGVPFKFPSMRSTMSGDLVIFGAGEMSVPEYVQQFMLMYALSMFSRYLPDLWIQCIDSHCKSARLIERLITETEKKFPILILGLLAEDDMVISTHRAPWYS